MSKMPGRNRVPEYLAAWNQARHEDLEFMADTGETIDGAAHRLGVTESAIEWWCHRNGRRDLWRRLTANSNRPGVLPQGRLRLRENA
jgi:hypothetical protein